MTRIPDFVFHFYSYLLKQWMCLTLLKSWRPMQLRNQQCSEPPLWLELGCWHNLGWFLQWLDWWKQLLLLLSLNTKLWKIYKNYTDVPKNNLPCKTVSVIKSSFTFLNRAFIYLRFNYWNIFLLTFAY